MSEQAWSSYAPCGCQTYHGMESGPLTFLCERHGKELTATEVFHVYPGDDLFRRDPSPARRSGDAHG